jgi:hypothetical protein
MVVSFATLTSAKYMTQREFAESHAALKLPASGDV